MKKTRKTRGAFGTGRRLGSVLLSLLLMLSIAIPQAVTVKADPMDIGIPEPIDKLKELVTVTIHASSREGELDDLADPIEVTCDKGSTFQQVMSKIGSGAYDSPFEIEGYRIGRYVAYHAIDTSYSECPDITTYHAHTVNDKYVFNESKDVYIPLSKRLTPEITMPDAICGTEISGGQPGPAITIAENSKGFSLDSAQWCKSATVPSNWTGTFEGDKDYYAYGWFKLDFGYYIDYDTAFTVNNGTWCKQHQINNTDNAFGTIVGTTAVHEWVFKDIIWTPADGDGYTAKANYTCGEGDDQHTKSVDCEVTSEDLDGKGTKYTATISADDSPDGKEHSDEKTVYNVYNLYVQGKHVTGEIQDDILSDGTVKYDPKTNTLTLNNATIESSRREYGSNDHFEYGIRANLPNADANLPGAKAVEGPLTIELIGENTIQNETISEGTTRVYGVANESQTKLTFTGGGSLNIDMPASGADSYTGIEVRNALEFNGVAVKIGMDGSKPTRGLDVLYSNPVKLSNGAEVHIKTGDHADTYAFYNDRNNQDLTVEDGCVFEAVSDHLAFHQINITDGTKPLGALVNTKATKYEAEFWDEQTNLNTYKYVRIPAFRLTIHWSSVDGEDLMDPVKIGVTPGTSIQNAVKILDPDNVYGAYYPFEMEGYAPIYVVFVDQPLSAFKDSTPSSFEEDVSEHSYGGSEDIDDDLDVYFIMHKAIGVEPTATLTPPVCGTEVVSKDGDVHSQTNRPEFTVAEGAHYSVAGDSEDFLAYYWAEDKEDGGYFNGTIEGGKTYYPVVYLEADVGYFFDKDLKTIDGAEELIDSWNNGGEWIWAMASVKAVHDMEEHPGKEATCTEDGNKPYNVCKACDKWFVDSEGETEIEDHDEVVLPALGHDWDEGTVTKEPTATEPGVRTYTCKRCGETKTEEIPPTGEDSDPDPDPAKKASYSNTVGNGNVWEKGSGKTSDFTFKRSENDEETFAHFTYADVDGKKLTEGKDCEISAGSVIIKLKPAYLETLAVGEHTLTAHFDDGNSASAKFTVTNKSIKPTPVTLSDKGKSAPKTGDNNMLYIGIWMMLFGLAGLFLLSRKRVFARRK